MDNVQKQLEVCAFTIQTCIIAEKVGAVRAELCDNPIEGGTTPSYGTIKQVREKVSIQLFPIIRPRSLNYFYDEEEWQIIIQDVKMCKELLCDGISIGISKQDGTIDIERMKRIAAIAYPMELTCNRVIDAVPNPFEALEQIIDCGFHRILTSGKGATAPEGMDILKQLVQQADGRISIMPGAGVKSNNIKEIVAVTGAYEFHTSARKAVANTVSYSNPKVTDAGNMYIADEEELHKIVAILNAE
jgi:copper homeostasis protein